MSEWGELSLGEQINLKRGYDLPSKNRRDGNIPIFSSSGISGYHSEKMADGPGVITGRYGTIGQVFYSQDAYWPLNTTLYVQNFKGNDAKFVYYFLQQLDWQKYSDKSAIPGVNRNDVHKEPVSFPLLPEQKAIAAILSSLDDKIDLLHRQNLTLEAMAQTLFRQWFIEEAQEEWENGTIADLIEFNPSRKLAKGTNAPYLKMAALSTTTFNPDEWYYREFSSGTKFINGDTLLARITPCLENGKTAYITFLEDGKVAWGSTEYIVMRPKGNLHPFFAYTLARNDDFRDYAEGCLEGSSGRQRVDVAHLKNYGIKIPSEEVINEFNSFAESIVPKLHSNFLQIRTLEKLRDTLLPKLMSGEVRVRID
jgi:type I restriction enzyme S subunit